MSSESRPLVQTREIGGLRVHALDAGLQKLDGGAMFGVVPKPLWEKKIEADERNRIPLGMRCLLVEAPNALVLIDTGAGNKESDKFMSIYGIENAGSPTRLEDAIRASGHTPEAIDIVLSTHLHFDHAGGNTVRRDDGAVVPSFPQARYVVQRGEYDFGASPNERVRASYLRPNLDPVTEAGLWDFVEGDVEVTEGVSVRVTPGHTPFHQSVLLDGGNERGFFLADVCPTSAHVPLPWIMGYDVEPLRTLESKRALWRDAREEEWLLIFEHDADVAWGVLAPDGDRLVTVGSESASG